MGNGREDGSRVSGLKKRGSRERVGERESEGERRIEKV